MEEREKLAELLKVDTCTGEGIEDCYACKYSECDDCYITRTVDYLIANGVTVQEWISVEERLPKMDENPVLAVFCGIVNPAWCHGAKWELPSGFITKEITHWMPLPEPPKGE